MKKPKEMIALRDKKKFWIIGSISFVSMSGCAIFSFFVPKLWIFYVIGACFWGFLTLIGLIGLCFPKWVIAKEQDNLLVHNGYRSFRTIKIPVSDIVSAKFMEQRGSIILTVKAENETTKVMHIIDAKNITEVVDKLNSFITND